MADGTLTDLDSLARAAECLKVLAHPHRLRIVEMLLADRYTVGRLAEACDIPNNVASSHLRLMQRCGLLDANRDGRNVYYTITEPCLTKIIACVRERFADSQDG